MRALSVLLVICTFGLSFGSLLCETDFSAWWHTWVQHDQECTTPNVDGCPSTNEDYSWWRAIGFECESETRYECLSAQGHLRKEVFDCLYPSDWVIDRCGRAGITELTRVGWPNAWYAFATGIFGCTLLSYPQNCGPSIDYGNVCWRYTCSWSYCVIGTNLRCNTTEITVPTAWTCPKEKYNAGDRCDCNCGIWDPDCMDATRPTDGCPSSDDVCLHPGDKCLPRTNALPRRKELFAAKGVKTHDPHYVPTFGRYEAKGGMKVPSNWTCPAVYYAANDGCDCNCGAWDPDCDLDQQVVHCQDYQLFMKQLESSSGSDDSPKLSQWSCIGPHGECSSS